MLALCFGTRPQVIKASALLPVLRSRWPVMTIDTGQHYDFELNGLLYQQLEVPPPDHFLEVGSTDAAAQTAAVLTRTAEILRHNRPVAVLVVGDTNSTLGCALAANKENLPIIHVEAGLRSSEPNLPEEVNRRIVDVISTLLCVPSAAIASNLRAERAPGHIVITGDVGRDVLLRHMRLAPSSGTTMPFALATIHRAALTDNANALRSVMDALGELGMPVVLPAHPRTRFALEGYGLLNSMPSSVSLHPPMGYLETIAAVRDATVVVTDSGGLQREAYWLGTPCVTLRGETEWLETLECGANALVPPLAARGMLATTVSEQCRRKREKPWLSDAYGKGNAAERVADAVSVLLDGVQKTPGRARIGGEAV
jgi:UDP-GlcNAc3NAcA epimerase